MNYNKNEKKMSEIEIEKLVKFIVEWSADNNIGIVIPTEMSDDKEIDFININFKKKTIYIGELDVSENLTEVG